DKFVFGTAGYAFTVSNLDNNIDGAPPPPSSATIDTTKVFQTIEGLGGATAFYAGWITAHPYKNEIYTNAFAGLNLSMLRLGDWYRYQSSISTFDTAATEIVSNANRVLGHPVPVYMSSWAPPAFLKSNGQMANGVNLTWASIQNEPDWSASYDSCIFHPTEDTVTTISTVTNIDVNSVTNYTKLTNYTRYASYSKALDAVYNKLTNLPSPPKL